MVGGQEGLGRGITPFSNTRALKLYCASVSLQRMGARFKC